MKKTLYVNCCIRNNKSRTKIIADYFLENLSDDFSVQEINLMNEKLNYLSGESFEKRQSLLANGKFDDESFSNARDFADADVIVIATPFWDLSIPALLKVYFEDICVEKITFACNEKGMYGLCKAKDLVFITTAGGMLSDPLLNQSIPYVNALCKLWGIENFHEISAEGMDLGLPIESILENTKEKTLQVITKIS